MPRHAPRAASRPGPPRPPPRRAASARRVLGGAARSARAGRSARRAPPPRAPARPGRRRGAAVPRSVCRAQRAASASLGPQRRGVRLQLARRSPASTSTPRTACSGGAGTASSVSAGYSDRRSITGSSGASSAARWPAEPSRFGARVAGSRAQRRQARGGRRGDALGRVAQLPPAAARALASASRLVRRAGRSASCACRGVCAPASRRPAGAWRQQGRPGLCPGPASAQRASGRRRPAFARCGERRQRLQRRPWPRRAGPRGQRRPWRGQGRAPGLPRSSTLALDQGPSGHFGRLWQAHQGQQRRRDVGEAAVVQRSRRRAPASTTGTGLVVCAVCGPPVSGSRISSQLPWSAVTSSAPPWRSTAASDAAEAGIDRLHRADRGRQDAGVADHVGVGEVQHDQVVCAATRSPPPPCRSVPAPTFPAAGRRSRPSATAP